MYSIQVEHQVAWKKKSVKNEVSLTSVVSWMSSILYNEYWTEKSRLEVQVAASQEPGGGEDATPLQQDA